MYIILNYAILYYILSIYLAILIVFLSELLEKSQNVRYKLAIVTKKQSELYAKKSQ